MYERAVVNRFDESWTECAMNLHCGTDNLTGQSHGRKLRRLRETNNAGSWPSAEIKKVFDTCSVLRVSSLCIARCTTTSMADRPPCNQRSSNKARLRYRDFCDFFVASRRNIRRECLAGTAQLHLDGGNGFIVQLRNFGNENFMFVEKLHQDSFLWRHSFECAVQKSQGGDECRLSTSSSGQIWWSNVH